MPTQKNGMAVVKTNSGGNALSSWLPRRQPAIAPIAVPMMKARIVEIPMRPSVYGSAVLMS